ncbi:MAG TPA: helix-turn-helix domain-containing protein [Candidatus Nanoarchaeia archaeon]|nr:helix-turn-helix domain-containing protein [Candidatus Nanoarchaeia archaeon]
MDLTILKELGLTEREAKVYAALVEHPGTVGPLAKATGLAYTKVYEALNKLLERGLAAYVLVSKTRHFQASPPKAMLDLLDEKKKRVQELVSELELKRKYAQDPQTASVHDGFKACKALLFRIVDEIDKSDEYCAFALKEAYRTSDAPYLFTTIHKNLEEKKIVDKILAHVQIRKEMKKVYGKNKNIQIRFTKMNTPIGVLIVKNKVVQLVWGERPTAIEITSTQIYEQYKRFFDEIWQSTKR